MAIGVDMIDLAACKQYGVRVCNVPAASNESVAEQAIAMFFSLRRQVVRMHELTVPGVEWPKKISLKDEWGECPGTCREEVATIFGGGELGEWSFNALLDVFSVPLLSRLFRQGCARTEMERGSGHVSRYELNLATDVK